MRGRWWEWESPVLIDCRMARMVRGLERYQQAGDLHFVRSVATTRLLTWRACSYVILFEEALERVRSRYDLEVVG
jgi:hypothetical protein